jgi:hypothetical protein
MKAVILANLIFLESVDNPKLHNDNLDRYQQRLTYSDEASLLAFVKVEFPTAF